MRHRIAGGGNARLENVRNDKYWKAYNTVDCLGKKHVQGGHKPGMPGILRDFSEHGKLREFSWNSVQLRGKIE